MTLSYFDSSVLLSMLLEEERQEEALHYWRNSIRVSSILLKIETVTVLRRTFEINKHDLNKNWLSKKTKILDECLSEVNFMVINDEVEREIYLRKELAQCRSLDAIHIATALLFRKINNGDKTNLYSFDKAMNKIALHYKFKTNRI